MNKQIIRPLKPIQSPQCLTMPNTAVPFRGLSDRQLAALGMSRCPYFSAHVMKFSSLQNHLSRCYENMNTFEKNQWTVCPFNASHRVKRQDQHIHQIECPDNRCLLDYRQNRDHFNSINGFNANKPMIDQKCGQEIHIKDQIKTEDESQTKDKVKIKDEFQIKEEIKIKEENVNEIAVKVIEKDVWFDPKCKQFVSVYERSHGFKSAEDMIDLNHFDDTSLMCSLPKSERKRLNALRVESIRQKSLEAPKPNPKTIWSHFSPELSIKIQEKDKYFSEVLLKPFIAPMSCEPDIKDLSVSFIKKRLHSVEMPIDYEKLAENEAKISIANSDSIIGRSLRSMDLWASDSVEIKVLTPEPLRRPITNPFGRRMRRPKTATNND